MNKRGQELSTNAIIMIVIGIIVLVVLVIGFTIGWGKLFPFVFSSNNIGDIKTGCSTACSTNNAYDYCTVLRNVSDGTNPLFHDTCFNLAGLVNQGQKYFGRNYGIDPCSTITCSQ